VKMWQVPNIGEGHTQIKFAYMKKWRTK